MVFEYEIESISDGVFCSHVLRPHMFMNNRHRKSAEKLSKQASLSTPHYRLLILSFYIHSQSIMLRSVNPIGIKIGSFFSIFKLTQICFIRRFAPLATVTDASRHNQIFRISSCSTTSGDVEA